MEDEALIKKIMPHSIEAEQSVIGSMLMDPEAIDAASELLTPEDFYVRQNGLLFQCITEIHNEGKPADEVTLSARLQEKGAPEEMLSVEFVRNLLEVVPSSANVKHYAQIVYEKSTLRRLIKVSEGIAKDCYLQNDELENVLSSAEHGVFDLIQTRNTRDYKPISEVVMDALRRIEEAAKSEGNLTGLSTGFKDLDDKTTGLQPSDFVLIAARPSMGKTAFALNIAQHVAFKLNQPVAIFSLEMSEELLVNRLLSMEARVDAQNLRTGNLNENEWGSIMESAETIGKSNLIIDTTSGISISQLRTKARKYKLDKDIQLIIIDYLQLMSGSGKNDNRQSELSEISRGLKSMARELNIPVIALSQLSRKVEERSDKRPMMSDIRESGAIEQDADIIMFIYREDYYDKETDKINVAEINIAKQRNGPIGPVYLTWQPKYTKFVNSTKEQRN